MQFREQKRFKLENCENLFHFPVNFSLKLLPTSTFYPSCYSMHILVPRTIVGERNTAGNSQNSYFQRKFTTFSHFSPQLLHKHTKTLSYVFSCFPKEKITNISLFILSLLHNTRTHGAIHTYTVHTFIVCFSSCLIHACINIIIIIVTRKANVRLMRKCNVVRQRTNVQRLTATKVKQLKLHVCVCMKV